MSRRDAKKQVFYQALRNSVDALVEEGKAGNISQNQVITNAKYPDGKSVGETTLFGKNPKTGDFIHREFMIELDGLIKAANTSKRASPRKASSSVTEELENKRSEYTELKEEYDSVLAQFAFMMKSKENVNSTSNENRVRTLEADLYLVASLLKMQIDVDIPEISNFVKNYENKYSGQDRLAVAQDRVSRLERRIRDSKITSIFGTMNES